ncbi:MAG TPA: membrane protein insertase YidC [Gammaproteobacteria bacterium]
MDNIRLFLWFALLGSLWVSYTTWVADRAAPVTAVGVTPPGTPAAPDSTLPVLSDGAPPAAGAGEATGDAPPAAAPAEPVAVIHVRTDVLDLLIDTKGGDIVRVDLPTYPIDKADPTKVVRLFDYSPATYWGVHTGLGNGSAAPEPNHFAQFTSERASYALAEGEDTLVVALDWAGGDLTGRKVYTFHRGLFQIDLELTLDNHGATPWGGQAYAQMVRLHRPPKRTYTSIDSYSFTGPVLYDGDSYRKLNVADLATEPVKQTLANGWLAGIQHHFLAGAVPPVADETTYEATAKGGDQREYLLTAISPTKEVAAGATLSYPIKLFVGPKIQEQLRATANDMDRAVDYGRLGPLARPLFWVLEHIHDWVGNWGLAIIICTFLIKLAFYKLTAMSGRSMAKLRKLGPRMKALQERFKDDRQKLSQAMMELYKKEKVNPAAGCLPIVIQMPFFFAFYWVLVESVEMRQAPFMLWIDDLSKRDPFFILPILMGAAMLFQTRLSPAPPDPVQARVMQIMPIIFTVMFALFPAGLVVYWLTNTVLSILQQWRINTLVAREG